MNKSVSNFRFILAVSLHTPWFVQNTVFSTGNILLANINVCLWLKNHHLLQRQRWLQPTTTKCIP